MNENEEIKNENLENDEDKVDLSSLVDYYLKRKVDPLPAVKRAIIRQNVALSYEWFVNMHMRIGTSASWDFSTFRCLIQALPEYYGNYIEVMIEDFEVKQETIEKSLQHIRSGLIPYQIWIDKVIADIKSGGEYFNAQTVPSLVFVYLLRTMRTSIIGYMKLFKALMDEDNKIPEEVRDMVFAAHVYFSEMPAEMKSEYMDAFKSEDLVTQRAFQDNELSLFNETLLDAMRNPLDLQKYIDIENGDSPVFSVFWHEEMSMKPPLINRSRGQEEVNKAEVARRNAGLPKRRGGFGNFRMDVLGYGPNGETPEEMRRKLQELNGMTDFEPVERDGGNPEAPEEPVTYVVEKVAKDSSERVVSRSKFKTHDSAEQFIHDVSEAAPDMLNSFEFRIWAETSQERKRIK